MKKMMMLLIAFETTNFKREKLQFLYCNVVLVVAFVVNVIWLIKKKKEIEYYKRKAAIEEKTKICEFVRAINVGGF